MTSTSEGVSTSNDEFDRLGRAFAGLVARAGAIAMEVRSAGLIDVRSKGDASPVCDADERIEAFLLAALPEVAPGLPLVAEEAAARGDAVATARAFLLVDPIDGTREFIAHGEEFTINVALVVDGAPRAGAVYAPALRRLWFAGASAFSALVEPGAELPPPSEWRPLRTRPRRPEGLVALVSRSHLKDESVFLVRLPIRETRPAASSIKFCLIAEGEGDVYPRFGETMEWDTAAGDAILRAAGGIVVDPTNAPLVYGKADSGYRNGPFIAWGDPRAATLS